jgi:hypothetical protein
MPKKVVFLDFNSNLHLFIANIFFKTSKNVSRIISPDILVRSLWDKYIQNQIPICSHTGIGEYEEIFISFKNKIINEKKYISISNLLKNDKVFGIAVIQTGYFDWWLVSVAKELNKYQFIPESQYGFIISTNYNFKNRVNFLNKCIPSLSNDDINKSNSSLLNRINGEYNNSYLKFYNMKSSNPINNWKPEISNSIDINVILFLHAFTDSPNHEIEINETDQFIDHFHFCLKFIKKLGNHQKIKIYVKSHPLNDQYPSDIKFFNILSELIKNYTNIYFIPNSTSLKSINENIKENLIVLTGRGSITIEAAFLGLPVLNYCKSVYSEFELAYVFDESNFTIDYFKNIIFNHKSKSNLALQYEALCISLQKNWIFDLKSSLLSDSLNLDIPNFQYIDNE